MKREIKFRGCDMNGQFVYGLLTKKKIRSSGEVCWAIATGDCLMRETVPVSDDFAQLIGVDKNGKEIYEGDTVINVIFVKNESLFDDRANPKKKYEATFEDYGDILNGDVILV